MTLKGSLQRKILGLRFPNQLEVNERLVINPKSLLLTDLFLLHLTLQTSRKIAIQTNRSRGRQQQRRSSALRQEISSLLWHNLKQTSHLSTEVSFNIKTQTFLMGHLLFLYLLRRLPITKGKRVSTQVGSIA